MELKRYQQEVIADLVQFIEQLSKDNNLATAYSTFWEQRGVELSSIKSAYLRPYDNSIKGVPRVTMKVPTAGGKTFIACNALRPIFNSFPAEKPKVVAWFVPSDAILKQTYLNLNNPSHPYRQKIDSHFGANVRVLDKEAALFGQGLNPVEIKEQLTILVLSVQSFAANNKSGRRVYRENENLAEHVRTYHHKDKMLDKADETSLFQVIAQLNPVVIIDESHNFEANLRIGMLNDLNPSFILDLTATPRAKSNIISFVDAMKLKREHMVKLPVIVYNHQTTNDVIISAITLQRSLERKAKEHEKEGGKYIRPIVLFQAQPKSGSGNHTFDTIKKKLVESGIPEEQIAIKTAEKDEIKKIELMSRDCEVRYIITVNALKEGWDCPFAYILASLANKSSRVDVEQILGRVMRLPYAAKQKQELLNLSYVFTSSANFRETLENIITSLNKSGFSSKDYRDANEQSIGVDDVQAHPPAQQGELFGFSSSEEEDTSFECHEDSDSLPSIDTQAIKTTLSTDAVNEQQVSTMEAFAEEESRKYAQRVEEADKSDDSIPSEVKDMVNSYEIKDVYHSRACNVQLPSFVMEAQTPATLFDQECGTLNPLTKSMLSEGFDLSKEDHKLDFTRTDIEAVRVDLEENKSDEYVPRYKQLKTQELLFIREHIISLPPETQKRHLANLIATNIKFDDIAERHISQYILKTIEPFDSEQIADLITYKEQATTKVKQKIESLLTEYQRKQFRKLLDVGKIRCDEQWHFADKITPKTISSGLSKGLYTEEANMNDFEHKMISSIADLNNVLFWHRNLERGYGFCINGYFNHYPDFIVALTSGKIIIIETKGDDRDNSDSLKKLELGRNWANKAGENYRYYMVFDKTEMNGAYTINGLLDILREM